MFFLASGDRPTKLRRSVPMKKVCMILYKIRLQATPTRCSHNYAVHPRIRNSRCVRRSESVCQSPECFRTRSRSGESDEFHDIPRDLDCLQRPGPGRSRCACKLDQDQITVSQNVVRPVMANEDCGRLRPAISDMCWDGRFRLALADSGAWASSVAEEFYRKYAPLSRLSGPCMSQV